MRGMTIRGKEITVRDVADVIGQSLASPDARANTRAILAIGFFVAYLATAII